MWLPMVAFGVPIVVISIIISRDGLSVRDLPAIAIVAAALFFEAWTFSTVEYRIERGELHIRAAFLKWNIPIRDIESVTPTRSPLSSPALSLDRLRIKHANGEILVSPEKAHRFIEALRAVNPALRIG
jgi:hypothetical protein